MKYDFIKDKSNDYYNMLYNMPVHAIYFYQVQVFTATKKCVYKQFILKGEWLL